MFGWLKNVDSTDCNAMVAAINRSQAVIEFTMDGTIVNANDNFLKAMGYTLEEIRGRHHSIFVEPAVRDSVAYREFWAKLNGGQFQAAEYKRIAKGGREVWIQASCNPVLDTHGKPFKVLKFATDVTTQKMRSMEDAGQIAAIVRSQAVISFSLDGTVRTANDNFLRALGYWLAEIQGKHHSMFVEPTDRDSAAYREFWAPWGAANSRLASSSGSARAARKCGSSPATIRSSTKRAAPLRSSNSRPISRARS